LRGDGYRSAVMLREALHMKTPNTLLAMVLALSLAAPSPAAAQPAPRPRAPRDSSWALWLTLAQGVVSDPEGGAGALALTFQRRRTVLSARIAVASGPPCMASDCWFDAIDVALLAGYATPAGRRFHASVASGLSAAGYRNRSGIGLPLEVQVTWRATRFIGVTAYVWGNSVGPQGGVGIGGSVGRLR
jgi:hypothetical protein